MERGSMGQRGVGGGRAERAEGAGMHWGPVS